MTNFRGTITEVLTPFNKKGVLDLGPYREWLDFQIDAGVGGIFVNGLASEAVLLDRDEQIDIAQATVEHVNGRLPIMANVSAPSMERAVQMATEYERARVDAVCITNPYVYPYSKQSLFQYFESVASAVRLPVFIYNAPQSGYLMSPDLIADLKNRIKNVAGYKDSTLDLVHLQTVIRLLRNEFACGDFLIFSGSDAGIVSTLQFGGAGIISLISSVFPRLILDLCEAFFRGDYNEATRLQLKTSRVREILKRGSFLAGYKFAAELTGHPVGRPRSPLVDLTDQERSQIADELKREEMVGVHVSAK